MVTKTRAKTETIKDNSNNNNNKNIQDELNKAIQRGLQQQREEAAAIQSRTDIENLLEWDDVDEADYKLMSQVLETLASTVPQPTPGQLIRMNRGLIHLLQIISESPDGEISTRELLETINSGDLHKLIKKGEKLGFIERKKVKNPHGKKGNNVVVNSLAPMGLMLLEIADAYDLDRHSSSNRRIRRSSR
jgi:hypothetical protein